MDKFNLKSLDQIKNINLTIKCKNYDVFNFKSKFEGIQIPVTKKTDIISSDTGINLNTDEVRNSIIDKEKIKKKKSSSNAGIIAAIVIFCGIVLIGGTILTIYFIKKRKAKNSKEGETEAETSNNPSKRNDITDKQSINI